MQKLARTLAQVSMSLVVLLLLHLLMDALGLYRPVRVGSVSLSSVQIHTALVILCLAVTVAVQGSVIQRLAAGASTSPDGAAGRRD